MSDGSGFLSRWSRRKAGLAEAPAPAIADAALAPADAGAVAQVAVEIVPEAPVSATMAPAEAEPLPTLADVALLTRQSDYARFVAPGVAPGVKNAALKKLFSDPHFNIMDGLDTYIDDYGKPDPIPLSMLRAMNQSAALGLFNDEVKNDHTAPVAAAEGPAVPKSAPGAAPAPGVATPDGDTDAAVAQSDPSAPEPFSTAVLERAALFESDDHADLRLQQDDAARRPGPGPGSRA